MHVTSLCCSDTARKIKPSCGKTSTRHKSMQGRGDGTKPPLWPCNKVVKPNFQSVISQTNNDCSLLSLILAKLLLLDISCENIFALSIVTALTACPFSTKCAKMSVFFNVKTLKICWRLGASPPDPRLCPLLCQILGALPPPPPLRKFLHTSLAATIISLRKCDIAG